eukprot:627899_1
MHITSFSLDDIIAFKSSLSHDAMKGYIWWMLLTILSLYNICQIIRHWRKSSATPYTAFQTKMLYLSTVYVFVCAIRSIWPRKDVDRICFFDHPISTVFVGRSIATIAELCFVKQLSLVLNEVVCKYRFTQYPMVIDICKYYVILIFCAEIFSWVGVATKCELFNAIEESIWMLVGLHMTISYSLVYWKSNASKDKHILLGFILSGSLFVCFMCLVDIPMYLQRFYLDDGTYFSLYDGIVDLMECKAVVQDFTVWWEDVPWMTGYFSFGVWFSLYFIDIRITKHDKTQ